jgi:hypothetical protein
MMGFNPPEQFPKTLYPFPTGYGESKFLACYTNTLKKAKAFPSASEVSDFLTLPLPFGLGCLRTFGASCNSTIPQLHCRITALWDSSAFFLHPLASWHSYRGTVHLHRYGLS